MQSGQHLCNRLGLNSALPSHVYRTALGLLGSIIVCVAASAADDGLFLQDLTLGDGRVLVIAEAALEPRSIGSYSIRLYSAANPDYRYDDFLCGIVVARDGTLERIALQDTDGNGIAELVVITRSAGSGSYVSAQAFAVGVDSITPVARVVDLDPGQDPIEQLRH